MPIQIKKEIELEIAHVLFIDIVGYSKLHQETRLELGFMSQPRILAGERSSCRRA
jgi:hypothetical protein